MWILDRYIARLYVINTVAVLVMLFGFVVGIDIALQLKQYVGRAAELAEEGGAGAGAIRTTALTALCVIDIWGPRLLQLYGYVIGLVLVIAMGFTNAQLVRRRELVAALASGVSLRRLLGPFLAVAGVMLLLAAINQEFVLPKVAHLLPRNADQAAQRDLAPVRVPLLTDGQGRRWYAASMKSQDGVVTMRHVYVFRRRQAGGGLQTWLAADRAVWETDPTLQPYRGAWRLVGARLPDSDATPPERVPTNLDPTAVLVQRVEGYGQSLSWRRIFATLLNAADIAPQDRRELERAGFGRVATLGSSVLALLLAAPFFLVREPKGMVGQSLKSAPLILAATVGGLLGTAAPVDGFPVWMGVFVPCIVLTPMVAYGLTSMRS